VSNTEILAELTKKAFDNFENIKECIQGLYDILKIALTSENMYFNLGQDNIEALYENFLEMMINERGTIEFIRKLKTAEVDLDSPLGNL
jgi:intein/homing endonuclease